MFSENAKTILCKRYLVKGEAYQICERCGIKHESIDNMLTRVSGGNKDFYDLMANLEFLPNSPALFNMGTGKGTSSACFALSIQDSMEDIMSSATKAAMIQKWGGGVGFNLSNIRAKNALISTTHGRSCGPLAVMEVLHAISLMITQGGKRQGAQMAFLTTEHKDIKEFIHCKDTGKTFSTFNLSVSLSDNFMQKAINSNDSQEHELLREIAESSWKTGDPGVIYSDAVERGNTTPYLGKIDAANPCNEVPMRSEESCNLGSINLVSVISNNDIDYNKLEKIVTKAVYFLEYILDNNIFPLKTIEAKTLQTRKIGLGVMGWADLLGILGIHYDSTEAVYLAKTLMQFINDIAHKTSRDIAYIKGPFPGYIGNDLGDRNATLTCIAPTGTLSILAGVSSGIEPHYALQTERTLGDGNKIVENAVCLSINTNFKPKTAEEIPYEWHIKHQAAFQKYTDLAVSKTINMPNNATTEDVYNAYVMMWKTGCKGGTIYRDGSRKEQVLNRMETKENHVLVEPYDIPRDYVTTNNVVAKPVVAATHARPEVTEGKTYRVSTGCGNIYVTINSDGDKICELFATLGKSGGCSTAQMEAIGRLCSLAFRNNLPVEEVVEMLRGIRCPSPSWNNEKPILSCADAIGSAIAKHIGAKVEFKDGKCPECGETMINQEGCVKCMGCGYSRC